MLGFCDPQPWDFPSNRPPRPCFPTTKTGPRVLPMARNVSPSQATVGFPCIRVQVPTADHLCPGQREANFTSLFARLGAAHLGFRRFGVDPELRFGPKIQTSKCGCPSKIWDRRRQDVAFSSRYPERCNILRNTQQVFCGITRVDKPIGAETSSGPGSTN